MSNATAASNRRVWSDSARLGGGRTCDLTVQHVYAVEKTIEKLVVFERTTLAV
jgi:hypothetical protein